MTDQTAVVCDTTAYLPTELVAQRGIEVISLYVSLDGIHGRESEISDFGAFYEELRASERGSTTSQPSVGDFIATYEPLLDAGRDVVSIHISTGISGTYEAATQARERLIDEGKDGERVHVFDSRSACGGMGLCVLAAAAAAAAGDDAERGPRPGTAGARGAEDVVRDRHARVPAPGRPDRRRPRLDRLGAEDQTDPHPGGGDHPGRAGADPGRALERLRGYARQRHESGLDGWVVQHIQDLETAEALADDCREIFGCEPVFISEIGPVIGSHVGPGLLGVGSVSKEILDS